MAHRARTQAPRRHNRLSVLDGVVLGLIQGPTEVLPLSSSGHLVLVPALLDWPYARLPADTRKTFEVALHAGAGVALAWLLREDLKRALSEPLTTAKLALPAAGAGLALEDAIETKASNPALTAAAMLAGGLGLLATERYKFVSRGSGPFWLGIAQAAALVPGVSRNGATITAARALGFDPEASARLSWQAGLPIIGGAAVLKLVRLAQRGLDRDLRGPFAAGAIAAFFATLASAPLLRIRRHRLAGLYRVVLGAVALRRLHRLEWPRG